MRIVVNGGGKVGSFLASATVANGHSVSLIERRSEICRKVSIEEPGALLIKGDGCDVRYQQDAGVDRADVFVSVTGDDDDNLVACQIASEVFAVKRVIARVNNPKNQSIFKALGIEAVSGTNVIAKMIEEEISIGEMVTLQALKKGRLALVEFELPTSGAKMAGCAVKDLDIPAQAVILAILRGDDVLVPRGDTALRDADSVIALTSSESEPALKKALLG